MKEHHTIRWTLLLIALLAFSIPVHAQVYISEVGINGTEFQGAPKWVELHNPSTDAIDVSDYFLCNFPAYPRISELPLLAGNTTIPAGEYLVVAWPGLGDDDAEVGLYLPTTSNFGDANSIIDYMQYGVASHFREGIAVEAGVWEADAFVELPGSAGSVSRIAGVSGIAESWRQTNASPGAANPVLYRAVLSGGNEVPANVSSASGVLEGLLDGSTLTVTGSLENLEGDFASDIAGGAHLHSGLAGTNGPIAVLLNATVDGDLRGATFNAEDNVFEISEGLADSLANRYLYVNIHSTAYPSGELRGQMLPAVSRGYKAVISGSSEVPANTSTGQGTLVAEIQDSVLIVTGSFSNLTSEFDANVAGGAHLHLGMAGQNGGIEFFLNATTADDKLSGAFLASENTFPITEDQKALFANRSIYLNIHTTAYPGGEVRGQMAGLASAPFIADLSGSNEVPANASLGSGAVMLELSGSDVWVSGSFSGLNGAFNPDIGGGSHIHNGLAGQNGGIAFGITPTVDMDGLSGTFSVGDNMFTLDDAAIDALQGRANYVNIHTLFNAPGELRGQLLPVSSIALRSIFSGRAQTTPNSSGGVGGAMVEILGGNLIVSGAFTVDSPFVSDIGAHIHSGSLGVDGGVNTVLVPTLADDNLSGSFEASDNTFELNEELQAALLSAGTYINIHTEAYNAGEIRGQITPFAYHPFEAYLSFNNEVIADSVEITMPSAASGAILALVSDTTMVLSGSFSGLESDFNADIAGGAHVHLGSSVENGGIELMLVPTIGDDSRSGQFEAANNTFALSQEQADALFEERLYVNIHSTNYPAGELRGQILASGNVAPNTPNIASPGEDEMIVLTGDPATPFEVTWAGGDANANNVYYTWQLATDAALENTVLVAVSSEPAFTATFGDVASLLTSAGVELNGTITLYHSAYATDGSFQAAGDTLSVVLTRGLITSNDEEVGLPGQFSLQGNYPNPFNPTTTVQFDLPAAANVSVEIYNVLGQKVLSVPERSFAAGTSRTFEIDGSLLSSGMYLYRVIARMDQEVRIESGRMTLLK